MPPVIRIELTGRFNPWISAKDVMLQVMGQLGTDGAHHSTLEFTGDAVGSIDTAGRATMCSMAVEAGAKNAIFAPDGVTLEWLLRRPLLRDVDPALLQIDLCSDADAAYSRTFSVDASAVDFLIAAPPSPDNVRPLRELGKIKIDQVFIGTCTNGRLEDLRVAAQILKGQKLASGIRMIVVPATQQVMIDASRESLLEDLIMAGAVSAHPAADRAMPSTRGPLADGDVGLYTANRNFAGRQGSPTACAYLASPAVAAATAIAGYIASPADIRPDLLSSSAH